MWGHVLRYIDWQDSAPIFHKWRPTWGHVFWRNDWQGSAYIFHSTPPRFSKINLSDKIISGSTGPIFNNFLPYGRYLIIDFYRSDLIFWWLKGRCHGNYRGQNGRNRPTHLHSLLWTEWNIAIPISTSSATMIWLHCVKFGDFGPVTLTGV